MGFVKVVKNKAYFKRFQVKYRRRREGRTDYQARRALVIQDKNKYNTPKYRFVVRFSNTDVTCQIIYSKIVGDIVTAAAYSHELPRFGLPVGLTNYAAAYATGLLLARRHLTKLNLADRYQGKVEANGESEEQVFERQEGVPMPFRALLDVGLVRTTTGARVFAALKGAVDGGMNIPHSVNRFAGYNEEGQKLDAEALRKRIFGGHVADYMRSLNESDAERYKRQFSQFVKHNIDADSLEKTIAATHAKIRANPAFVAKAKKEYPEKSKAPRFKGTPKKLTRAERKGRVVQKKNIIKARLAKKAAKAK